jgi:titin
LQVVDDHGAAASDVRVIDVAEGSVAAPSDLDVSVSKKDVGLAWSDNANNEAGFQVERGKKTKGVVRYTKVGSVGPNVTSYTEALAPGTYYFRVKAFGPGGAVSEHSNVVKVSIKDTGKGSS